MCLISPPRGHQNFETIGFRVTSQCQHRFGMFELPELAIALHPKVDDPTNGAFDGAATGRCQDSCPLLLSLNHSRTQGIVVNFIFENHRATAFAQGIIDDDRNRIGQPSFKSLGHGIPQIIEVPASSREEAVQA